ncbi:MAG: CRISPR system precrRNA processing endoribonuclease RAMP protein Cas6 [Candidatus Acididesulfobacter diazotrophicus]|jgi:hypothetical protein|uniref:CRISPR system precrRNA processing endoribonuclease RAMP protein Cas6 n=1 Tax=Candidatus Acididesulfobacter diazotrophicus TaxID=2597226 RepID=A0A519BLG0_9DELT|nr:MAG: CRISPR system precrRNA processing endoribonuclease RAMP protein Cas6 [Candidatus Acididesulfobacter diazotrophicus]
MNKNISEILNEFKAAKLNFEIKAENDVVLPDYKGSTFRGVFGYIFKDVMCISYESVCETCSFDMVCMFKKIFDSPPPSNSSRLKNYSAVPHPYIIEAPLETKNFYKKNEIIKFSLILIGQAIFLFPYFAYSFGLAGRKGIGKMKRGKFMLFNIINDKNNEKLYNYKEGELVALSNYYTINDFVENMVNTSNSVNNENQLKKNKDIKLKNGYFSVSLNFITPTRIIFNEKLISNLEFHIFIRNILRRISNLNFFHCVTEYNKNNDNNTNNGDNISINNDISNHSQEGYINNNNNINFNYYIEKAYSVKAKNNLKWWSVDRYSNRQKKHIKLSGFIGDVLFENVPSEFLWIIKLGEVIHIGKNTTFGNGKYKIVSII